MSRSIRLFSFAFLLCLAASSLAGNKAALAPSDSANAVTVKQTDLQQLQAQVKELTERVNYLEKKVAALEQKHQVQSIPTN